MEIAIYYIVINKGWNMKKNFSLQDLTGRLNQVAFSNTVNKDIAKFIKTYYKKDFSKFSKEKLINIVVNCLKIK